MDKTIEQQAQELLAESLNVPVEIVGRYDDLPIDDALRAIARALTRPAPSDEEVEAANWIRAWRNRFISERMNAYRNDLYDVCRAKAEADANDFEEAFREFMARAALGAADPT